MNKSFTKLTVSLLAYSFALVGMQSNNFAPRMTIRCGCSKNFIAVITAYNSSHYLRQGDSSEVVLGDKNYIITPLATYELWMKSEKGGFHLIKRDGNTLRISTTDYPYAEKINTYVDYHGELMFLDDIKK